MDKGFRSPIVWELTGETKVVETKAKDKEANNKSENSRFILVFLLEVVRSFMASFVYITLSIRIAGNLLKPFHD
jgi:hypothetical protein